LADAQPRKVADWFWEDLLLVVIKARWDFPAQGSRNQENGAWTAHGGTLLRARRTPTWAGSRGADSDRSRTPFDLPPGTVVIANQPQLAPEVDRTFHPRWGPIL